VSVAALLHTGPNQQGSRDSIWVASTCRLVATRTFSSFPIPSVFPTIRWKPFGVIPGIYGDAPPLFFCPLHTRSLERGLFSGGDGFYSSPVLVSTTSDTWPVSRFFSKSPSRGVECRVEVVDVSRLARVCPLFSNGSKVLPLSRSGSCSGSVPPPSVAPKNLCVWSTPNRVPPSYLNDQRSVSQNRIFFPPF